MSQNALEDLLLFGTGADGRGGLVRGGDTDLRGFLACAGGVAENCTGEGPALVLTLRLRLRLPSSAERARKGERRTFLEVGRDLFGIFGVVRSWTSLSAEETGLCCCDDVDIVLQDVLDELDLVENNFW